jgi:hypothetical protein
MIKNLPAHMQRVCDGVAAECTKRLSPIIRDAMPLPFMRISGKCYSIGS